MSGLIVVGKYVIDGFDQVSGDESRPNIEDLPMLHAVTCQNQYRADICVLARCDITRFIANEPRTLGLDREIGLCGLNHRSVRLAALTSVGR